jgi:hypothetical protein
MKRHTAHRPGAHRRSAIAVRLAALTLAVAAGVVVALVLVAGSPPPPSAAGAPGAAAAARTPAGAATVKRRDLVQTDTESGTLSYANPQTVYDRLSGTITWLPGVGQTIKPGGALLRVNGEPVTLMSGAPPAYRDLSAADSDGADVLELNRNLVALGFNANGITVDDVWQPATTLGVELLQESLDETATGSLSLGTVVFLPGPQLVSTVDGTVGDTANGGGSGTPASTAAGPPAPEFVSMTTSGAMLNTTATTTGTTSTPTTSPSHPRPKRKRTRRRSQSSLAALEALLKAESAQLRAESAQLKAAQSQSQRQSQSPSHGGGATSGKSTGANAGASSSGAGASGTAVLETTSSHLVVTVDLDASLQSEAKVGERVTVQLPAGNTVNGKVTAVSSVAQGSGTADNGNGNGNGSGSASTIPVTVTLSGHHRGAGLDEAAVSVNFAQQRANHVLSVPVTALVAVSGGNYALQEASPPHTLIPVTVGLFAAGYVQVSGAGIHSGLQVTDSQG